jgi:hypothetical protein
LEVQRFHNYLLTLDEDIDFCKGAINSEWDEFEDIIDFQNKTAGDTCPEYPTIKQLKEETTVLLFDKGVIPSLIFLISPSLY